jgi:hypothetical protein
MSDHLAIMGVSVTLRNLLLDRMVLADKIDVTISAPDAKPPTPKSRLNLFLYHVTENPYLKNQDIAGQGHPGSYGHPPLSLILRYLMTAFGTSDSDDLFAQQVLGDAMRVLHDFPIVTDALQKERAPVGDRVLDDTLSGAFEQVKVALQPASVDDLSKIWTALPEANLRPSVTYEVSVVQIESRRARATALPVLRRGVAVFPLQRPHIADVFREPPLIEKPAALATKAAIAEAGDTVRLVGFNLRSDAMRVLIGGAEATPVTPATSTQIDVTVPNTLPVGVHAVEVVHDWLLGDPPLPHRGPRSNVVPFLLIPTVTAVSPDPSLGIAAGEGVTVFVDPPLRATQKAELVIGDFVITATPLPPGTASSTQISFVMPSDAAAIPAGDYLMRLRVEGAESRMTVDDTTGEFNGPTFKVS